MQQQPSNLLKPLHFSRKPSSVVRGAFVFCFVVGLVSLVAGFISQPERTWGALLFNFFFFFLISICAMAFSAMQEIVEARWGRPIKRLHESFGSFIPWVTVFFTLFLVAVYFNVLGAGNVYSWVRDPSIVEHFHGKNVWLTPKFMVVRNIVCALVICLLTGWQLRAVLTRDKKAEEGSNELMSVAQKTTDKLRYWSSPVCVLHAVCFSVLGFDLLMSLSPLWFSTLWAAWLFAIGMQCLFATLLLTMFILKPTPIGAVYSTKQFHDIGKLLHGFTIFFAYLTYAHVLTYWYGNVPEETEYFLHRMHQPWYTFVLLIPFFSFVIPLFALIPKAAKYTPVYTPIICMMILISQWFVLLLVVMPEIIQIEHIYLPFLELGTLVGVVGLFIYSIYKFGSKNSMVSLADPLWTDDSAH